MIGQLLSGEATRHGGLSEIVVRIGRKKRDDGGEILVGDTAVDYVKLTEGALVQFKEHSIDAMRVVCRLGDDERTVSEDVPTAGEAGVVHHVGHPLRDSVGRDVEAEAREKVDGLEERSNILALVGALRLRKRIETVDLGV